jgi:hypothetical protein
MKLLHRLSLLSMCIAAPAFAVEFETSGQVSLASGLDNYVYFTDYSDKNGAYVSGQLRLRLDAILTPTLRFNTEIQTGDTLGNDWDDREGISAGLYSKRHEHFILRMAHIAWDIPSYNARLNVGVENISLPSATFGNPVLDGSLGGISYNKTFDDDDKMQIFFGRPIYDHDYIQALYAAGVTFDLNWTDFRLQPYYLYAYYEYRDDTGFGFTDKLKKSYLNVAGTAATYRFTQRLDLKFDVLYGDQNNEVVHYYETKGHHAAVVLDYQAGPTYGIFAWHSSGNGKKLDQHDDFGFVPMIMSGGFAPTRLGFSSKDRIGRQGIISETGAGTAGAGIHIKNIRSIDRLQHTFRVAYIQGTSTGQGSGAPVSATVPSFILDEGESGYMTNKDHAVEFNFDSEYEINRNLSAQLDLAYIVSGYDNKTYDKNPFNVQVGVKYTF